jgi:hypothetical protein
VRIPVRFRWSDPLFGRIAWAKAPRSENTGDFPAFAERVRSVIFQRRPQQKVEIGRIRGPRNSPALRPVILRCGVVLSRPVSFREGFSDFRHVAI